NMSLDNNVNFEEIARSTENFNGAQCKAVCIEAGMIALRNGQSKITHADYVDAISEVMAKKRSDFDYYT
ncbi:MAG: 26S proteasome regulatory subunit 6A, partial [Paramarteilia canceri]